MTMLARRRRSEHHEKHLNIPVLVEEHEQWMMTSLIELVKS
jgi:hypothetical protein